MTSNILNQISEGLDLAIYLHNEINNEENEKKKKNQIKYLGQCLIAMKENLNVSRSKLLPQQPGSGEQTTSSVRT